MIFSSWRFEFTPEANEDIERLSSVIRQRILKKIKWFIENFEDVTPLPLHSEWKGFFKIRVGDWRAIYQVDILDRCITFHLIDHRSRIYRR